MGDKKRKILFLMPSIGCGGVETTLFSLLKELVCEDNEITLLLLEDKGTFFERIPEGIKICRLEIPERFWGVFYGKKKMLVKLLKRGSLWKIPAFLCHSLANCITENRERTAKYFNKIASEIPCLEQEYDVAIDYFGYASFTTFYLAEKVKAKVKVSWLHSILSRFSPQAFAPWYKKMDVIFACSQMVKQDFEEMFPELKSVRLFYNIIDPNRIRALAKQGDGFSDKYNGVRILTVGRVCQEKGQDMAAQAFMMLRRNGYSVRWYLIGGGSQEDVKRVKDIVAEEERDNFVFLGIQENPYAFMRQCDIYVQPSRFEGYCTTTNEARILGKAIVMTDVSGAREQIEDGKTGLIVQSTAEEIYGAVKAMLDSSVLREIFEHKLNELSFDTRKEIQKLDQIVKCE